MKMNDLDTPFLILSGAYCSSEIQAEFGTLPPALLPVGNRRLFEHQVILAGQRPVFLTLPSDYTLSNSDKHILEQLNVRIIHTPPSLNLVEAIQMALEIIPASDAIEILLGDTLVDELPSNHGDYVAIKGNRSFYHWTYCAEKSDGLLFRDGIGSDLADRDIVIGLFRFQQRSWLRGVLPASISLPDILNSYERSHGLKLVEVNSWYDFGHLALFYQSRRHLMVSRSFNHISSDGKCVVKRSDDARKIQAERTWYANIDGDLSLHVPRLVEKFDGDQDPTFYTIEYLNYPTLSDLFVFGELSLQIFNFILEKSLDLLEKMQHTLNLELKERKETAKNFQISVYEEKSRFRIQEFLDSWDGMLVPTSLNGKPVPDPKTLTNLLINSISECSEGHICFWHGDFFFGNMFFDFRANRVMLIDPRGMFGNGDFTIIGDQRYDIAKLLHSVIGYYDRIIAGRAWLERTGTDWFFEIECNAQDKAIEVAFWQKLETRFGYERAEMTAITALLFLSMLPLHADSEHRQALLLANGLRLFQEWHELMETTR